MDIKIITKCDRFLIHIETITLQCLVKEMEKIGINLIDHLIYFYDNEEDKVVLLDDQDLQYAFNQKENIIKFYVYYKLSEPIINLKPSQNIIDDFKLDDKKIHQIEQDDQLVIRQEQKMTILPEERRRIKLRNAIEQHIDNLLFNQYEI